MSAQQSLNQSDFDPAPIVKLYVDAVESWKNNYDRLARTMMEAATPAPSANQASGVPMEPLQSIGPRLFRKMVETEMELCRFYETRWSQYLKLPEAILACKSPMEFAELQANFCSRLAADYTNEGAKLFGALSELVSHTVGGDH